MSNIFRSYPFIIPFIAWAFTQGLKFIIRLFVQRRRDPRMLFGSGGMPSVHTAFVVSLATLVFLREGASSLLFAATLVLSLIVIYDALHVRYQVGQQAKIINRHLLTEKQNLTLHEEVGHTFREVVIGAGLGILLTILLVSL